MRRRAVGCACCNASDELLAGIAQLLRVSERRGFQYHNIIIEMSGVNPANAKRSTHLCPHEVPLNRRGAQVAEPKNIRREFVEAADAGHMVMQLCELQTMITVVDAPNFLALYASQQDISQRPDLCAEDEEENIDSERKVVDLLVEQIECADHIIMNKRDRCGADDMERLHGVLNTLNPTAAVLAAEWGKVPLETVLAPRSGVGRIAAADDEDDLREALRAAKKPRGTNADATPCTDSACAHSHGDGHGHGHGHSHSHEGSRQTTTSAAQKFGITSFVYARRRPFHPQRLMQVIMYLPVKVDPSTGDLIDAWDFPSAEASPKGEEGAAMKAIIRSKGFVWIANQHRSAQYWSHAGHYFELRALGLWWAATALDTWPDGGAGASGEVGKIAGDFALPGDAAEEWGDRRQEVVFIGVGMDEAAICALMDTCLLTDDEMALYRTQVSPRPRPDIAPSPYAPAPSARAHPLAVPSSPGQGYAA